MTVEEMLVACNDATSQGHEHMILVVTRAREPRGQFVRLAPGLSGRVVGTERLSTGRFRVVADVQEVDARRFALLAILSSQAAEIIDRGQP